MSAPFAELETPLEHTALLCRGCMAESGEMKDMMEWGLSEDFYKFTDVQVDSTEGLSQLLCTKCEDSLTKCRIFRDQCWNSNMLLKSMKVKFEEPQPPADLTKVEEPILEEDAVETTMSCVMYDNQLVILITAANSDSKIYLSCPYQCPDKYIKKRDLLTHLARNHHIDQNTFTIDLQYYCLHRNCCYHVNSNTNKWFSGRKFLNQHYNKVHKFKSFRCEVCDLRFASGSEFNRHLKTCDTKYSCQVCETTYNSNEKLLVHLMRRHPDLHKQYKDENKANKRKAKLETETKKAKTDSDKLVDYICDSPKRSSATQTLKPEENIKNDVTLTQWYSNPGKSDYEAKTDEISTQTVFEDLLSLKSQNSEDESLFFSETVSLSDIQTQTFPVEFGLSRTNKETITSETQSPDLSIKETQTCVCLYDSPKVNFRLFDSVSSSPSSTNLTSTQTQTLEFKSNVKSDVLLSFNSTQTQTCFDEKLNKDDI